MIRALVDFALGNRFIVLTVAALLSIWGAISFHNLPVEAYPDVANNYVTVITQWPGRAAEEVEQQVSIPIEIVMNGIPHLQKLRSVSLAGPFQRHHDFRRRLHQRLESCEGGRTAYAGSLPQGLQPQIGTDWSPVGQIYFFTLHSTNPQYDVMDLKSLEDWTVEKAFKSVPNVVDVASFGGPTREYQVRIDPSKLISYGLSIGQLEQQIANNNVNGGGNFIQAGAQQINVREVGLVADVHDIAETVTHHQERRLFARSRHRRSGAGREGSARAVRAGEAPG
jgi:heavy metal efflux system protein